MPLNTIIADGGAQWLSGLRLHLREKINENLKDLPYGLGNF